MDIVWSRGRVFDEAVANTFAELVRDDGMAVVRCVVESPGFRARPVPMNTVEMLKVCSRALGMGPQQAMRVAERLYLNGFLTYPRTESTRYPASFNLDGAVSMQVRE